MNKTVNPSSQVNTNFEKIKFQHFDENGNLKKHITDFSNFNTKTLRFILHKVCEQIGVKYTKSIALLFAGKLKSRSVSTIQALKRFAKFPDILYLGYTLTGLVIPEMLQDKRIEISPTALLQTLTEDNDYAQVQENYNKIINHCSYPMTGDQMADWFLNGAKENVTSKALRKTTGRFIPYQNCDVNLLKSFIGVPGQIRVDDPDGIKIGKSNRKGRYFNALHSTPDYFFIDPPEHIKQLIFTKYGITKKNQAYWSAIIENRTIPLVITEGFKKAAMLTATGIPAIAATGYTCMLHKRYPGMLSKSEGSFPHYELCGQNRPWLIMLDSDPDQVLKNAVDAQCVKLVRALDTIHRNWGQEANSFIQVKWNPEKGKGIDDLITNCRTENWVDQLEYTAHQATGKQLQVDLITPKSQRYLGDVIPSRGIAPVVFLQGDKGCGKTYSVKLHVAKEENQNIPITSGTHRRKLTRDIAKKLDLEVLEDLANGANTRKLALVLHSLHSKSKLNRAIKSFAGGLFFIDEIVQVGDELLTSDLTTKHREEIIIFLSQILTTTVLTGGQVICADADLNQSTVDFIMSLIDVPVKPFIIQSGWQEERFEWGDTLEFSNPNCRDSLHVLNRIVDYLAAGKRVIIPTSSQKDSSRYGGGNLIEVICDTGVVAKEDCLLIDATTTNDPDHEAYHAIRNEFKSLKSKQLVVYTPVLETGVSLQPENTGKFDLMVAFVNGQQLPNSVRQALSRYRDWRCPRHLVIWGNPDQRNLPFHGSTDSADIVKQIERGLWYLKKQIDGDTETEKIIAQNKNFRPLKNAETYLTQRLGHKHTNLISHTARIIADQNKAIKNYVESIHNGLIAENAPCTFDLFNNETPKNNWKVKLYDDPLADQKEKGGIKHAKEVINVQLPTDANTLKQLKYKKENLTTEETWQKEKLLYQDYLGLNETDLTPELVVELQSKDLISSMRFFYLASTSPEIFSLKGRGACRSLMNEGYLMSDFDLIKKLKTHQSSNYLKYLLSQEGVNTLKELVGTEINNSDNSRLWNLLDKMGLICCKEKEDSIKLGIVHYPHDIYPKVAAYWAKEDAERLENWEKWESIEVLKHQLKDLAENSDSANFNKGWEALKSHVDFSQALCELPFFVRAALLNAKDKINLNEPKTILVTEENQAAFKSSLAIAKILGLDLETHCHKNFIPALPYPHKKFNATKSGGLDHIIGAIRFMQIYCPHNNTVYILDLGGREGSCGLWVKPLLDEIQAIITAKLVVGHNLHFDLRFLRQQLGWRFSQIVDTRIMMQCLFHVYNGSRIFGKPGFGLGSLAKQFLNLDIDKTLQVSDWGGIISQNQIKYAALDAWVVVKLYERLKFIYNKPSVFGITKIKPKHEHYQLECDTVLALVEVEPAGMPLRMEATKEFIEAAEQQFNEVTAKFKAATAGLKPTQTIKVRHWLNEKYDLNLSSLKKATKKTYAKKAKELNNGKYQEFVWLKKATDLKTLLNYAYKAYNSASINNGKVVTQFKVLTGTGRTASGNKKSLAMPNIQSVPKGKLEYLHEGQLKAVGIRELHGFEKKQGDKIVISDLSASHNRIGAALAKDEKCADILRKNLDQHTIRTLDILKCLQDCGYGDLIADQTNLLKVLEAMDTWYEKELNAQHKELVSLETLSGGKGNRDVAKTVSYGSMNGSGAGKVSEIIEQYYGIKLTKPQAKLMLDAYWASAPAVQQYIKEKTNCVEENTFKINGNTFGVYYHGWGGHYMSFPINKGRIQPTKICASLWSRPESTIIKRALIRLQTLINNGELGTAKICNIVHDELDVCCSAAESEQVSLVVNTIMQEEMSNMLGDFIPPDTKTAAEIAASGSGVGLTWAEK